MDDLYFAYGSNLDAADWSRFCAERGFDAGVLRPVGRAALANEMLVFDYRSLRREGGVLNIHPSRGSIVEGYLFEIHGNDWTALDVKEGHPLRYRREAVTVVDAAGDSIGAQTYRVIPALCGPFVAPSAHYLAVCRRGRTNLGLSLDALEAAAAGIGIDEKRSAASSLR